MTVQVFHEKKPSWTISAGPGLKIRHVSDNSSVFSWKEVPDIDQKSITLRNSNLRCSSNVAFSSILEYNVPGFNTTDQKSTLQKLNKKLEDKLLHEKTLIQNIGFLQAQNTELRQKLINSKRIDTKLFIRVLK